MPIVTFKILGIVPLQHRVCTGYDGQQSSLLQHFLHVNLLHAGVAYSPSVVPLLAGYEHEHPVEHVPLPPETLIHFCNSARHCHVHEPVQGCSVVVVVVVDDVLLVVVDDVVVPVLLVVVVVGGAVLVVLVVVLEVVDVVVELVELLVLEVVDDELLDELLLDVLDVLEVVGGIVLIIHHPSKLPTRLCN